MFSSLIFSVFDSSALSTTFSQLFYIFTTLTSAHTQNFNFSFNSNFDLWFFDSIFNLFI